MERFKFMVITTIIFALPSCGLDKHQLFTSEVTNRKGLSMLLLKFITVQVKQELLLPRPTPGSELARGSRQEREGHGLSLCCQRLEQTGL